MNQHRQRYDQAQQEIVRASEDLEVFRMLDLGVGAGETTRRCLETHPAARAVCLDQSRDKLDAAANVLGARAELRLGRFQDRLDRAQSVVSPTDELLAVLGQAGFQPEVRWEEHDLVVIAASVR